MSGSAASKHIAVVPVADVDDRTDRAIAYAETLAQQVFAVALRDGAIADAGAFADRWASHAPSVPLVVLEGLPGSWDQPLGRVLQVLRRTGEAELVTVVLPARSPQTAGRNEPASWTGALDGPGIVVRETPPASQTLD